jgi:hypothetical protein
VGSAGKIKNIIHWNKQQKKWTSHTYKGCSWSDVILVIGNWYVETKPEKKKNPKGWVCTDSRNVILNPTECQLGKYQKLEQIFYDKQKATFNITNGHGLLFDREGCYTLIPNEI